MNWCEGINLLLLILNICLGLSCLYKMKSLSDTIKEGRLYHQCKIVLQGILLVEFYFILVLFSWVTNGIFNLVMNKSMLVTFLYVTALNTKSILFFIILVCSVRWTDDRLKKLK